MSTNQRLELRDMKINNVWLALPFKKLKFINKSLKMLQQIHV